jgi:type II secretory ATPase GspE/PulE/Tfp pilus assembly ATPase PilB-like protein
MIPYALGHLGAGGAPQEEEMGEHLAQCGECRKELEGTRAVVAKVEAAQEEPITKIAKLIVERAIIERASDIHIQALPEASIVFASDEEVRGGPPPPDAPITQVRYRIDGVLIDRLTLPDYVFEPLINHFKQLAGLELAETRAPQDGRFSWEQEGRKYDLRVSTLPTVQGESLVMRILDPACLPETWDILRLTPENEAELLEVLHAPRGMFFVTGPTGSGKTTTLYMMLQKINNRQINCSTVEDPVEYALPGVNQVSVDREAGLTFERAMRAIMRQDPDVIMCGEIRDLETGELVLQAALTGHLALSTLHSEGAPETLRRMLDIGLFPQGVADALLGVLGQWLARTLCPECKRLRPTTEQETAWLRAAGIAEPPAELYERVGCEKCMNRGYHGRMPLHELFLMNDEVRRLLKSGAPSPDLEQAVAAAMWSFERDGAEKVVQGLTDMDEVRRFTGLAG